MPGIVSCPILSNADDEDIMARVNYLLALDPGMTAEDVYRVYPELLTQDILGNARERQRGWVEAAIGQYQEDYPEAVAAATATDQRNEIDAANLAESAQTHQSYNNYTYTAQTAGSSTQTAGDSFADFVSDTTGTDGWTGNADGSASYGSLTIYPTGASDGSSDGGGGTVTSQSASWGDSGSSSSSGGYTSPTFSRPSSASSNFYSSSWSVFSPGVKINNVWLKEFNPYADESEDIVLGDLLPMGAICSLNEECETGLCEAGICSPNENITEEIENNVAMLDVEFGPDACQEKHWESKTYEADVSQYAGQEVNLKVIVKGASRKYCNLPDHKMWIRADNFEIMSGPTIEIVTDKLIKNESGKIEVKINDINGDLDPLGVFIAVNAGGVWKVGADVGLGGSASGETMNCQGNSDELTCFYRVAPDYTWGDAVVIYASAYDMAENYTGWSGNWKGVLITEEFEDDEDDEDDEGDGGEGVPPEVLITSGNLTMNIETEITATVTDADGDANPDEVYLMVYSNGWKVGDGANSEKMDCTGTGSSLNCSYSVTPNTDWGVVASISVQAWDIAGNTLGGWGDQDIVDVNF